MKRWFRERIQHSSWREIVREGNQIRIRLYRERHILDNNLSSRFEAYVR